MPPLRSWSRLIDGLVVAYYPPVPEKEADSAASEMPSIAILVPENHKILEFGARKREELLGHPITRYIKHEGVACWIMPDALRVYYHRDWLQGLNHEERLEAVWAEAAHLVRQLNRINDESWWERVRAAKAALLWRAEVLRDVDIGMEDVLNEINRPPL